MPAYSENTGDGWSDIYFDNLGLLVQRDGDGGDTAQREGWAWFGVGIRTKILGTSWPLTPLLPFEQTMDLLVVQI